MTDQKSNLISAWILEEDEFLRRRLGKLGEELGELISIKDRVLIQGLDESDPKSGKPNIQSLLEECADVEAQIRLLRLQLNSDDAEFEKRVQFKINCMHDWEQRLL